MYRHLAALVLICSSLGSLAEAATLLKVKGDQVLIDLQGEASSYNKGDRYLVMVDGKKKAVVEIANIKGQKAIGKVLKGTAVEQGTLAPLPGGAAGGSSARTAPAARSSRTLHRTRGRAFSSLSYGVQLGYDSASQSVLVGGGTETVAMSGAGFSLKAFGDYPISGAFGAIGRAGIEQFSVKGTSTLLGPVSTSIMYLDADLLLRYHFLQGNFHPFPLVGAGLFYPLSKTSGVLDVGRISATTIFFVGGGVNYSLSDKMYIHGTLEYGIFPPSNDVKTSLIAVRGGVAWAL